MKSWYESTVNQWNKRDILKELSIGHFSCHVYVGVQFYSWFKIYLPLFWGMIILGNDFKTKGNKF